MTGTRLWCRRATRRKCTPPLEASLAAQRAGTDLQWVKGVMNLDDLGTMGTMFLSRAVPGRVIWQQASAWRRAGKRWVRFTTAALVNELIEAKQNGQVKRVMTRWMKYDLIALDEVGYVPLADIGAEFLFQVISDRAEHAALIDMTNLCARCCWIGSQTGTHHRNRDRIISVPTHGTMPLCSGRRRS